MLSGFNEYVFVRYEGHTLARIFNFTLLIAAIILPYIFSYRSQGIWNSVQRVRETPIVKFKHETILVLSHPNGNRTTWTTLPGLAAALKTMPNPTIISREADNDFDGRAEFFELDLRVPVSQPVTGAKLLLLFDYTLFEYSDFEMETAAYATYYGREGNSWSIVGDLTLVQKEPLLKGKMDRRFGFVVPRKSMTLSDYSLHNILSSYAARNVSTELRRVYETWGEEAGDVFRLRLKIFYPEEAIDVWAGFWERFRLTWVNFCPLLLVSFGVARIIQRTAFKTGIFGTRIKKFPPTK